MQCHLLNVLSAFQVPFHGRCKFRLEGAATPAIIQLLYNQNQLVRYMSHKPGEIEVMLTSKLGAPEL
jgi:hypothetical protein